MIGLATFVGDDGAVVASHLADVKDVADIVGATVTAVAVLVGGIWAYFKFVKGRTYRPRLEVILFGQWQQVGSTHLYHARVTVKNIGASIVNLLQEGTGLRFNVLAADQPRPTAPAAWRELRVSEIFLEHDWIEPGETVSDDLLLHLGPSVPTMVLLEVRLVWKWSQRSEQIVVFARRVIPVEASIMEG